MCHLHPVCSDLYPCGWVLRAQLALVRTDEFGRRQHMPRDRLLELSLRSAGAELGFCIEGVQAKDVAVAPVPRRRARAAVARRAEVVPTLARRRLPLAQPLCDRIEAPGDPVCEDTAGS